MNEEDISKIIHSKFENGYGFDPFTILTIISICISVYRVLKECKAAKAVIVSAAKRKGLAYRTFVKNRLKDPLVLSGINPDTVDEIIEEMTKAYIKNAW